VDKVAGGFAEECGVGMKDKRTDSGEESSFNSTPSHRENLSSNTLFHFLPEARYLKDILRNGVITSRYNYEKLPKERVAYISQMVCFCDIPLGKVKYHLDWYGPYGIGITRKYARRHKVSPVIYVHSDTTHTALTASDRNIEALRGNATTPYLKQYTGYQDKRVPNGDPQRKRKRFYDEREWRFVPRVTECIIARYSSEDELKAKKIQLNTQRLNGIPIELDEIRKDLPARGPPGEKPPPEPEEVPLDYGFFDRERA
jgi:hypothetical protein